MSKPVRKYWRCNAVQKLFITAAIFLGALEIRSQVLRITDFDIGTDNKIHVSHNSVSTQYYILYRGDTVTAITFPRALHLGASQDQLFVDDLPATRTSFYRILGVPQSQPRDVDGDGIDDVYELSHPGILSPLNPSDASLDSDGDGLSNLQEY